jgi:predicted secreted protein
MKKLFVFITTIFISTATIQVQAKNLVRVKAIGASPRGQYVAFEEFGYKNGRKIPFSKIRVMNVWKNKYVDTPIQVIGAGEQERLNQVREKAKELATKKLQKFNIST